MTISIFRQLKRLGLLLVVLCVAACDSGDDAVQFEESIYADDSLWLCKPGIANDQCLSVDQTTTVSRADGSFEEQSHVPASNPHFDCFYVYPTVDNREEPGNTEDFSDIEPMLRPLVNQAARFTSLCNVYAPLYHQMTIGTYGLPDGYRTSEFFDIAYSDVEQAFNHFLAESNGRPFVLLGHSQGSHVLIRLLQEKFDSNPAMLERLISALVIGPVGALEVPAGDTVGGSFQNIPLCTAANQSACVIAYDSIAAGAAATRPARALPCVNPTLLGGTNNVLQTTYWESDNGLPFPFDTPQPYVAYDALHSAECEADGFLGIGDIAGTRAPPLPTVVLQSILGTTLHVPDMNFALGDLLRIVETQASMFR
ncbi:MAG: DUF3089 domain-containing protein [Pseudomonadales bacterium]